MGELQANTQQALELLDPTALRGGGPHAGIGPAVGRRWRAVKGGRLRTYGRERIHARTYICRPCNAPRTIYCNATGNIRYSRVG